jgi:hypothetical protein
MFLRSEAKRDFDGLVTERSGGDERRLNEARFAYVIFADAVFADATTGRHFQFGS